MTIDAAEATSALLEEREKLVHQLRELGADEDGKLTGEMDYGDAYADAGAVTAERTEVLGLVDGLVRMVREIDAALKRVEDGTYGICARCGDQIEPARMEVRPTSILCVTCKTHAA